MYKKVIAIKNEIKNNTIKVQHALKTLDAIAQYALQQNDMISKKLADEAFAMLPLYKKQEDDLDEILTTLQFTIAKPVINRLTPKLLDYYNYSQDDAETLEENSTICTYFTDKGTLFLWILDAWSDSDDKFKVNAVIIDNEQDEIIECDRLVDEVEADERLREEDYVGCIMDALKERGY